MAEFTYKNQSTKTILSVPLRLGFLSRQDRYRGLEREILQGDTTISRPVTNKYGTRYMDVFSPEFCMWKEDETPFTQAEQRTINAWFSSPKHDSFIEFVNYNGETTLYRGIFTDVSTGVYLGGVMEMSVLLRCDSPYVWEKRTFNTTVSGSDTLTVMSDSDELEEFVYPLIRIMPHATETVSIKSVSDNGNIFTVDARASLPMMFDTKRCIVSDGTVNGIISYSDLGWRDVGNIYWPRLLPFNNTWEVTGNLDIEVEFYVPHKRLGDFI